VGGGGSCLFAAFFGLVRTMVKMTTTASMKRLDVLICHLISNHFDLKYHEISITYVYLGRFLIVIFDHQWLVTFNKNQVGHKLTGSSIGRLGL